MCRFPPCRNPKILGITLDPSLTFSPRLKDLAKRARSRLNIMRALAGFNWGQSRETLLTTYKALIKPFMTYDAPVSYPNSSVSYIRPLQAVQNVALHIQTVE